MSEHPLPPDYYTDTVHYSSQNALKLLEELIYNTSMINSSSMHPSYVQGFVHRNEIIKDQIFQSINTLEMQLDYERHQGTKYYRR